MSDYTTLRQVIIDWLDDNYHFGDAEMLIQSDDMSFMDHAILNSLGFVQLLLFLETTFDLVIDRKDISRDNFDGMAKIISYVTSHQAA